MSEPEGDDVESSSFVVSSTDFARCQTPFSKSHSRTLSHANFLCCPVIGILASSLVVPSEVSAAFNARKELECENKSVDVV